LIDLFRAVVPVAYADPGVAVLDGTRARGSATPSGGMAGDRPGRPDLPGDLPGHRCRPRARQRTRREPMPSAGRTVQGAETGPAELGIAVRSLACPVVQPGPSPSPSPPSLARGNPSGRWGRRYGRSGPDGVIRPGKGRKRSCDARPSWGGRSGLIAWSNQGVTWGGKVRSIRRCRSSPL
jgi:hypothetical protein